MLKLNLKILIIYKMYKHFKVWLCKTNTLIASHLLHSI